MRRFRFTAGLLSVALAASLCPGLALADSLVGGSTAGAISFPTVANTLTTQSSKKTVYVLAEVRYANDHAYSHRNYDENGAYAGDLYEAKERSRTVYSYNKNGLVTNSVESGTRTDGDSTINIECPVRTVKYKGNNISRISVKETPSATISTEYAFTNKKGKPRKVTCFYAGGTLPNTRKEVYTFNFNAAGTLRSYKQDTYSKYDRNNKPLKKFTKVAYHLWSYGSDKKGRLIWGKSENSTGYRSDVTRYTYDKRGNLKASKYGNGETTKYEITYKNGRVNTVQRVGSTGINSCIWKKVKVPASVANIVQAQQWSLMNGNQNKAFGPVGLGIAKATS